MQQQATTQQQLRHDKAQLMDLINDPQVDPTNKKIYANTVAEINKQLRELGSRDQEETRTPGSTTQTKRPSGGLEIDPFKLHVSKSAGSQIVPTYSQTVNIGAVTQQTERKVRVISIQFLTKVPGMSNQFMSQQKEVTASQCRSMFTTTLRDVTELHSFPDGHWAETISFQRLTAYYKGLLVFRNATVLTQSDLDIRVTKSNQIIFEQLAACTQ